MRHAWVTPLMQEIRRGLRSCSQYGTKGWAFAKKTARRPVDYSWSAAIFQGIALAGCGFIFIFGAPPGVAVACLAVAAVVMSFRVADKDFGKPERIIWIVLAAVFLQLEITSISADRRETSRHEEQLRQEEREKFKALLDQGKAINGDQKAAQKDQLEKFRTLLSQGEKSIRDLGAVASSVAETSGYASGGSSYPEIFPHAVVPEDGKERVGFSFQKIGKYPLFDLRVAMGRAYSVPNPTPEMSVMGTVCTLGEVNGNWSIPLLGISLGKDDAAYFVAQLEARNGTWEEVMDVRRVNGKLTSRWIVRQIGMLGDPKTVSDLADQDFPVAHRFDVLFPTLSLPLPDISKRQKDVPDKVWGPSPLKTGGCSAPI